MATCPNNKIDSNVTGLRFAWERCLKELWPTPIWKALEPNSYADFGQTITTVARNPINPSRQRKKGTVTDMDAAGGFNQDVTQDGMTELLQSFFFANARERGATKSIVHQQAPVTAVDFTAGTPDTNEFIFSNANVASAAVAVGGSGYRVGDILSVAGGTGIAAAAILRVGAVNGSGAITALTVEEKGIYGALPANPATLSGGSGTSGTANLTGGDIATFVPGELVLASGFGVMANNGIKTVADLTDGTLEVVETVTDEASPPAAAALQSVGFGFDAADVDIAMNGGLVRMTSSTVDLTSFNLLPGEWLFIGGDSASNRFANNVGFGRVSVVDEDFIEFDKVTWPTPVAEVGTGKSIHIYWGTIIRNEADPDLIVRKPLQLERTLGRDTNGVMSEYLVGAVANELTLNVAQAAIVTMDVGFVACESQHRSGLEGVKAGSRPALISTDAFNTTDNFSRIKLSAIDPTSATPVPLFAFCTDLTLTVNNNVSPNKAIGVLGAFDTTAGTFEVGGELTAYFADVAGPKAVRNNLDMTIDYILVKDNAGMLFDLPLIALGNGSIAVEQDQAITLPLETNAAESKFGHTLLMESFAYLPDIAG